MSQLSEFLGAKVEAQRAYFATGATLGYEFRMQQLRRLLESLHDWWEPLCEALWMDLHKSREEAILTELSIVEGEIRNHMRNLRRWMRTRHPHTPLKLTPSRSSLMVQPLGSALIIAPWNYPVQLLLNPLVGAISSGCTAFLKTSPAVPNVARVLVQMIGSTFQEQYITAIDGHREVNTALLEQHFDIIFFTGSPSLGKTVMQAATRNLTPVVLELGGKSPTVVARGANVEVAAKRIAWGKSINAGQTCIAPDYLLIHASLKEQFVEAYGKAIATLFGDNVAQSKHFGRMVSEGAFDRVRSYISEGKVLVGGGSSREERFIEPTLVEIENMDSAIMQEEIFGPVLPMVTYEEEEFPQQFISSRPHPLALYYFGPRKKGKELFRTTLSGGGCLNDTIMHIANEHTPFGGVGNSGMGRYHGKDSFLAFSHLRSILSSPTCVDVPFRYMPYRLFPWIKRLL